MVMLEAIARVMVVGQVEVVDRVVAVGQVAVGQVVAGLRGRPQVLKVVHRPDMAKRRLEKRRVATGLGIVVNTAKRVVS